MIIGTDITKDFVENLSERELNNPEGAGFDIRVREIFKVKSDGFLGIETRKGKASNTKREIITAKSGKKYISLNPFVFCRS